MDDKAVPFVSDDSETCAVSSSYQDRYYLALPSRTISLPHDRRWSIHFHHQGSGRVLCARLGSFEIRGINNWFFVSHDPQSGRRVHCHIDFDEHATTTRALVAEAISDFKISIWEEHL
jgi:hypothetical protein